MSIEINIWKNSGPSNKGPIKSSLIAGLMHKSLGHVNMIATIDETHKNFDLMEKQYQELAPRSIKVFQKQKNKFSKFLLDSPEWIDFEKQSYPAIHFENDELGNKKYLANEFIAKELKALEFTHSFWPKTRPTVFQSFKSFFKKGGIDPLFRSLQKDKYLESEDVNFHLNGQIHNTPLIIHDERRVTEKKEIIQNLSDSCSTLYKKRISLNLKQLDLTESLTAIKKQQEILTSKLKSFLDTYSEYQADQDKLLTTQSNMSNEDGLDSVVSALDEVFLRANRSLMADLKRKIKTTQKEIDRLDDQELINKSHLVEVQKQLINVKDEITENLNTIHAISVEIEEINNTEGKNPDYTLTLPSSDSTGPYHLDILKILDEMKKQRQLERYRLLDTNCAAVIKKCIHAGISPELEQKLTMSGLKKSFFKISIETPMGVLGWINQLNRHLDKINQEQRQQDLIIEEPRLSISVS